MNCCIEILQDKAEEAYILTIPEEDVKELIVLLVAYKYDKIEKVSFTDLKSKLSFQINSHLDINGIRQPVLKVGDKLFASNWTWFDTVVSMLLDVCILGWAETSHIDYEFQASQGNICVSLSVAPPNMIEN